MLELDRLICYKITPLKRDSKNRVKATARRPVRQSLAPAQDADQHAVWASAAPASGGDRRDV